MDDKYLIQSPGAVTDYNLVEAKILELYRDFDVAEVAYDRWGAPLLRDRLEERGVPMFGHGQGYGSMKEPMKAFERAVLGRVLRHGGNPLLRWCVGNVIVDMDPAGDTKPNKKKAKDKIDPAVAAVMAVGRAEYGDTGKSVYEDKSKRPDGLMVW